MSDWESYCPSFSSVMSDVLNAQVDKPREWDEDGAFHASDLAYFLPDDDGGLCTKRKMLEWHGHEGKPRAPWDQLMLDQGFAFEEKVEQLVNNPELGFPARGYRLQTDVRFRTEYKGRPWVGEADGMITHLSSGRRFIWENKTHRSGAEKWLDSAGAKRAHQVQGQWYAWAAGADGILITYVSRDGASRPREFFISRDDEEVCHLMDQAHSHREGHVEVMAAQPQQTKLKKSPAKKYIDANPQRYRHDGKQWIKSEEFWLCSYCPFYETDHCDGSVKEWRKFHVEA